jgi:ADP-ribose pyrophosphatase YjhB (NUDIX family)
MTRTDYYHQPNAPAANSIVVAVTAFIVDDSRRLLMIRRTDNDKWAIPGGGQEIGETISEAAVREVREETGLDVEVVGLIGVYSDPLHIIAYDDGEVRQQFSICLRARPMGSGTLHTSDESKEVRWVKLGELADLDIHPAIGLRIKHGYQQRPAPYIG